MQGYSMLSSVGLHALRPNKLHVLRPNKLNALRHMTFKVHELYLCNPDRIDILPMLDICMNVSNNHTHKMICLGKQRIMQCTNAWMVKNIARVRNCPDVAIVNSLCGPCRCVFVLFLSFCNFVFYFFIFLSSHHSDQMSEGSLVPKAILCAEILKWHWVSDWLSHWPRSGIELPGQLKI